MNTDSYAMRLLWIDTQHLNPKLGHMLFNDEEKAARELACPGGEEDDGEGEHDDSAAHDREKGWADYEHSRSDDHEHDGCREDDHGDRDWEGENARAIHCRLDPRKWNELEQVALDKECDLVANLLVNADELLALIALHDARNTPIQNPKHAKEVLHEIAKAERELKRAYREWDEYEYDDAIQCFKQAWMHAEHAVKDATS